MRICLLGEDFELLPLRALWWPRRRTLLIADTHLGKGNVFRLAGVPVPEACDSDLARLSSLISNYAPDRLIILGDLLHAPAARSPEVLSALARWRNLHRVLDVLLVRGNHDLKAGDPPACLRFRTDNEPAHDCADDGPVRLAHVPPVSHEESGDTLTLCGHIHPAIRLHGPVSSLRAACFWYTGDALVLPAFGSFTGCASIAPREHHRVFVVGDRQVHEPAQQVVVRTRQGRLGQARQA